MLLQNAAHGIRTPLPGSRLVEKPLSQGRNLSQKKRIGVLALGTASASFLVAPEVAGIEGQRNAPAWDLWTRWKSWWTLRSPVQSDAADSAAGQQNAKLGPLLKKVSSLCEGETLLIVAGLVFLFTAAACELFIPHFATKCIFAAGQVKNQLLLASYIKTLVCLVAAFGVASAVRGTIFSIVNNRMSRRLRSQLFGRLIQRETAFFDSTDTGSLTSRLQSDCQAITRSIATNLNIALRNGLQALGGGAYLFVLSKELFLITLGISVVLWSVALLYGDFCRRTHKIQQDVLAESNTVAEEVLSLSRVVRTFGTEAQEEARYGSWLQRLYDVALRQAAGYGLYVAAGHVATYSSKIAALAVGCAMVLRGELTPEQLTNFIFYIEFFTYASLNVCGEYTSLMEALGASERVLQLLDAEPARQISHGRQLPSFSGRVDFENVTFSYASRPNQVALNGVSLSLEPGKLVALVGVSGSGKTTIVALLQRLYDVAGGRILIDGVDLREVDAGWYRSQIGVVNQEPRLFGTSIAENIIYGCGQLPERPSAQASPNNDSDVSSSSSSSGPVSTSGPLQGVGGQRFRPTRDEIIAAATAANAHAFITALPNGYDTRVSDKLLSGGQKQRIALARALVRQPRLLVLDEATSALDAESEAQVQQALDRAMAAEDRAVVVIAHRLSTVRNADTILVMDRGQVAEQGTHEELLALKGKYYRLICRQQGDNAAAHVQPDAGSSTSTSNSHSSEPPHTAGHVLPVGGANDGNGARAAAAASAVQTTNGRGTPIRGAEGSHLKLAAAAGPSGAATTSAAVYGGVLRPAAAGGQDSAGRTTKAAGGTSSASQRHGGAGRTTFREGVHATWSRNIQGVSLLSSTSSWEDDGGVLDERPSSSGGDDGGCSDTEQDFIHHSSWEVHAEPSEAGVQLEEGSPLEIDAGRVEAHGL